MKILAIRGKNLASLAGDFAVDFEQEPLKSSGLFAISGPTGAGKSTLLDALCMALYENTPRLIKAGGNKTLPDGTDFITHQDAANLLRRGCVEGHAEVDFSASDGAQYRARWSIRRARGKIAGSLQPSTMTLKTLPDLTPIGGTKNEVKAEIASRIGLKFEQFTRAVLLAQNEFSSFLKADDNERGELLETLTGSAIYSQISRRAFERAKTEQQLLTRISDQLAGQKPLSDEQRSELESNLQTAQQSLATLDAQKLSVESRIRWYQEDQQLESSILSATAELQQRQQAQAASIIRQSTLQSIESVQSARPLLTESNRLQSSIAACQQTIAQNSTELFRLAAEREQLQTKSIQAQTELSTAEQHQREAQAPLDLAKALDATINTLQSHHQQLQTVRQAASDAALLSQQQQHNAQTELHLNQQKQAQNEAWLEQHSALQMLAENWSASEILLKQASQAQLHLHQLNAALAQYADSESQQTGLLENANLALSDSAECMLKAGQQRQIAHQQAAAIDLSQLAATRQKLSVQREELNRTQNLSITIARLYSDQQVLLHSQQENAVALTETQAAQTLSENHATALHAALRQAERCLKTAEAACAENVETLRASLQPETPCLVCGALEHPYQSSNPQLHAMLENLQQEVDQARRQTSQNAESHATLKAQIPVLLQQQSAIHAELLQCQNDLATQQQIWQQLWQASWQTLASDTERSELNQFAGLAYEPEFFSDPRLSVWLSTKQQQLQLQADAIASNEADSHAALHARDAAQAAFELVQKQHNIDQQAVSQALHALQQTQAARANALQQKRQAELTLSKTLDELMPVMRPLENPADWQAGWKISWETAPEQFQIQCAQNARLWLQHDKEREQLRDSCNRLSQHNSALQLAHSKVIAEQQRADQEFLNSQRTLQEQQAQRQTLFQGQEVKAIETQLQTATQLAKTKLAQASRLSNEAELAHTRSAEAIALSQARLTVEQQQLLQLTEKLQQWLLEYNQANVIKDDATKHNLTEGNATEDNAVTLDLGMLQSLLLYDAGWISQERSALQAIQNASSQASTILEERRRARETHQLKQAKSNQISQFYAAPVIAAEPKSKTKRVLNSLFEMADESDTSEHSEHITAVSPVADSASTIIEALQNSLAELNRLYKMEQERASHYQLSLAQDQARRLQAADILQKIELQEVQSKLWGSLNELIGSADGKKFRNYAQQYTLDVLLGYANRHLHQLSRRYRLQRIEATLALMVIDQDMGDEQRSVHSLSGGESFLVSLALALGLASLSSNRVRVESLFIDEGFGSLDAETLRVAMDALDGLQAMGRKVGVISHVQEMTERISSKILVSRVAGGRSLVTVG